MIHGLPMPILRWLYGVKKGLVSVVGDCTEEGDALSCSMDGDRGGFRLVASTRGEVLLTINSTLLLQRTTPLS